MTRGRFIILSLLFIALIFRLAIAPFTFNGDIITEASWAKQINDLGYQNFYPETHWIRGWPQHPPLISIWYGLSYPLRGLIMSGLSNLGYFIAVNHLGASKIPWFFNFTVWLGSTNDKETNIPIGIFYVIKFLPIFADILLGGLIYLLAKKFSSKYALLLTVLYLFLPFSWYISAVWGQSDQVATFVLLLSFISLLKKQSIISLILFVTSFYLKPTVGIFIPLYLYFHYVNKTDLKKFILGSTISLSLATWWLSILTFERPMLAAFARLVRMLFFVGTPGISTSAFNFWFLIDAGKRVPDTQAILLLPAKMWGFLAFAVINYYSFKIIKNKDMKSIFSAMFTVGTGAWMFLTNMYERYLFAGFIAGLLICIYNRKLLKYWILLSFTYLLNMHSFWYPDQFGPLAFSPLQRLIQANNWLLGKMLSITNIAIFVIMSRMILKEYKIKLPLFLEKLRKF